MKEWFRLKAKGFRRSTVNVLLLFFLISPLDRWGDWFLKSVALLQISHEISRAGTIFKIVPKDRSLEWTDSFLCDIS